MKIGILTATLALAGLSFPTQSYSQDIFDGAQFYVGGFVQGSNIEIERSPKPLTKIGNTIDGSVRNASGGLIAGVDFRQSSFLYGIEADYQFGKIDLPKNAGGACFSDKNSRSGICSIDNTTHLRAKVGYNFKRIGIFATAGLVLSRFETQRIVGIGLPLVTTTDFKPGFTIGAGAKFALNENWDFRIEYLRDSYSNIKAFDSKDELNSSWTENTVRGAVLFKF